MCGICGGVRFDGGKVFDEGVLEAMVASLEHRGPDDAGVHVEGGVALGFRRLEILDLSRHGRQPMANADGSVHLVFNGEIYNHRELRRDLEARGHRYRGRSDTESVLYQYQERGTELFGDLLGMFALAIWDRRRRRLVLGRDRVGKKPLYLWEGGGRLLFASELKALLADPEVSREVDLPALADYLSYGYVPAPRAIFAGIRKLTPGTFLEVGAEGRTQRRYWSLRFEPAWEAADRAGRKRAKEELIGRLEEAVAARLESDVPLGAFLSGGVDSSTVVALMARVSKTPVHTASVGFEAAELDELPAARAFARRLGIEASEMVVRPDALEALERICWHFDEPFGDASAVPTYYLCQMARQRVTVALSGDGGDEAFAGYRHYRFERVEERLRRLLPAPLRGLGFGALAWLAPKGDWLPRVLRAKTLLTNLSLPPARALAHSADRLKFVGLESILRPELREQLDGYHPGEPVLRALEDCRTSDPVSRAQHLDSRLWLPEDILVKVDRASMAHSLEVRSPFLDHRLLEFAARCPSEWWLAGAESKAMLKEVARPWVGDETLHRKKQGFSPPIASWLRGELRPRIEDELLAPDSRSARYLDPARMAALWKMHSSGRRDLTDLFWCLVVFETWHRTWVTN